MEVFFNTAKGKASRLVDALRSNVDGRKKYQLSIFTCYLADNLEQVDGFVEAVSDNINLTDVKLYIDARECIRIGLDDLREFEKSYDGYKIGLEVIAIDTPNMFHSKAYALMSHDEKTGVLAVGSANFTGAGLLAKKGKNNKEINGNYETLLLTDEVETVQEFLELKGIGAKYFKSLDSLEEYRTESFSFKYALLQQGYFVHQWSETLNQHFAVRYKLSEKGKSEIGNDILKALGFAADADTISRQFFDFKNIKNNYEADEDQLKRLRSKGIETYLGHWVPAILLDGWDDATDIEAVFAILKQNVEQQLLEREAQIVATFESLKNEGFIETDYEKDPIQELREKLNILGENHVKLYRLWHKFYIFELPYNLSQKDEIEALYEDLIARSQSKKRKNVAERSVLKAKYELRPIEVSEYFQAHEQEDDGIENMKNEE